LLQNIASYGFLVIAEGAPKGGGSSDKNTYANAINWIAKTAGTGSYANVDASKIMAAGFSCGGVEAMDNIWNSNVDTIGVISSGLQSNTSAAKYWKKPVLFVLGGSSDVAYSNVSTIPSERLNIFNPTPGVRKNLLTVSGRANVTSRICHLVHPPGRATLTLAMVVLSTMQTVDALAKSF
jgi:hypothetical protein